MDTTIDLDAILSARSEPSPPSGSLDEVLERRYLHAAAQGDIPSFEKLVELYQDRIYQLCFRFLGCREDAAEACQDVFINAFKALPKYRPEAKFSTWLYRIAVNRCRDFWKRSATRLKSLTSSLNLREHDPTCPALYPDDHAQWSDDLQKLDSVLASLPRKHREILILCCVENLSHKECATILRTSERAIEGRLYRAREALRRRWEKK